MGLPVEGGNDRYKKKKNGDFLDRELSNRDPKYYWSSGHFFSKMSPKFRRRSGKEISPKFRHGFSLKFWNGPLTNILDVCAFRRSHALPGPFERTSTYR